MTPTLLNLFFVQEMLKPCDPRGWKKYLQRQQNREYYLKNAEKIKRQVREYREDNLAQVTEYDYRRYHEDADRRADTIERAAASAKRDPVRDRTSKRRSAARPENRAKRRAFSAKPETRAARREDLRRRRVEDPEFRILENLRNRTKNALKNITKGSGTRELLGMDIPEYRIYLQGQFRPGMTWENYGTVWHVDHIRPCASFDLSDPAQQRECFNWSNTQPLFAEENLRKGDYLPA